jgi:hypothetical protein
LLDASETVSEPTIARATWDYEGQTTSVWEAVIPWLPSEPPTKKNVFFRVTAFDRITSDTRNLYFEGRFTNPGDELLGFDEIDDETTIKAVGL